MRLPPCLVLLAFLILFLSGCSGLDSLLITNDYPFAVRLTTKDQDLGIVEPNDARTFVGYKRWQKLPAVVVKNLQGRAVTKFDEHTVGILKSGNGNGSQSWQVNLPLSSEDPQTPLWNGIKGLVFALLAFGIQTLLRQLCSERRISQMVIPQTPR